jgi:hypothetical protein
MPIILATEEAEIGRIMVPDQPRQKKFMRPHFNGKKWAWWNTPMTRSVK